MNNIDVSKVSLYSEFPPLVDYQDVTLSFSLPSSSVFIPMGSPTSTTLLYDQTHSVPIDKAQGIADVRIDYDGMVALVDGLSNYSSSIGWMVRSTVFDFTPTNLPNTPLVGGKNVSFKSVGADAYSSFYNQYIALNFFVWFDTGRLYCQATLNRGVTSPVATGYTATWAGGTVTLVAKVSLLPY